jgi:hypothetical protein
MAARNELRYSEGDMWQLVYLNSLKVVGISGGVWHMDPMLYCNPGFPFSSFRENWKGPAHRHNDVRPPISARTQSENGLLRDYLPNYPLASALRLEGTHAGDSSGGSFAITRLSTAWNRIGRRRDDCSVGSIATAEPRSGPEFTIAPQFATPSRCFSSARGPRETTAGASVGNTGPAFVLCASA